MITVKNYIKPDTLEAAYELNQKRANRIIGGMMWLRMGKGNILTAIDLSGLLSGEITETDTDFHIGSMCTLRQLETHPGLAKSFGSVWKECTRHIVGVQFRNGATVGGSIFGRYGFSDILTAFLVFDTKVKLYKKGIIPLSEFITMDRDRDILEEIIVAKDGRRAVYLSERRSQTDFPVLTCAAAKLADGSIRAAIGARPGKAVLYTAAPEAGETAEGFAARFAAEVKADIKTESNLRGGAEYRRHLADVLTKRAVCRLEG